MTLKIKIAWIGKTKEAAIEALSAEYLKRLSRFAEAEGVVLRDEAALLRLARGEGSRSKYRLVLLESSGKQFSSEEFAEFVRITKKIIHFHCCLRLGRLTDSVLRLDRAASTIFISGKNDHAARTRAGGVVGAGLPGIHDLESAPVPHRTLTE